jgi:hypothetical protein
VLAIFSSLIYTCTSDDNVSKINCVFIPQKIPKLIDLNPTNFLVSLSFYQDSFDSLVNNRLIGWSVVMDIYWCQQFLYFPWRDGIILSVQAEINFLALLQRVWQKYSKVKYIYTVLHNSMRDTSKKGCPRRCFSTWFYTCFFSVPSKVRDGVYNVFGPSFWPVELSVSCYQLVG